MNIFPIKPRLSLNKAFLKVKPNRSSIEQFKSNLIILLDRIDEIEREENQKNCLRDFLRDSYYKDTHEINTKDSKDLVIHLGKTNKENVGVIIEAKRPSNKSEMISANKPNAKALHEIILYYFDERVQSGNNELKRLIITNVYEWYIFDANDFDKYIYRNTKIKKLYETYKSDKKDNPFFYEELSKLIPDMDCELPYAYFDIRDYDKPLRNADKSDDSQLIALFKILSPEHLLKTPFANDSNSLDKSFYTELLHIMGLTENKVGGKKIIERKKAGERDSGSLIESAISQLDSLDKLYRLDNVHQYGSTQEERLFSVALELTITWINRILFLKLLEAQLLKYQKHDPDYSFLNISKVENLDALNSLFFSVLARKIEDRNDKVKERFAKVPYLNSSLFEPTELEQTGLFISQLQDSNLSLLSSTVIKTELGARKTGELPILEYIFEFLKAYDFSSEGSEEIQEENKTLINASVLGLIFEKINGYKDGSFFTPGFITMYMCRETLRRAVVQKFNEVKNWQCETLEQLYDKIEDRKEANSIINTLKVCDPAVGSGHFLVSALNELIAIKSELKILSDRQDRRLKEYAVEVVNDELVVTDENGELYEYNPKSKESQRIQEALFHEKQTIIENCLFGVDINPNSVKICRLRLWIELLKNAYYKGPDYKELETLPNIDINIKCGNSLISRYALDADIKKALKKSKWTIDSYKLAVMSYRNAQSKDEKREMERLIDTIKNDFESEVASNDKRLIKLNVLRNELLTLTTQTVLFEQTKAEKAKWDKEVKKLTDEIAKLETELEEIKSNKIYENAFEWRFEFPEVLNDDGEFIGFDVVIGNPPYAHPEYNDYLSSKYYLSAKRLSNTYTYFMELSLVLVKSAYYISFIVPNTWLSIDSTTLLRKELVLNNYIYDLMLTHQVFGSIIDKPPVVDTVILQMQNRPLGMSVINFTELNQNVNIVERLNDLNLRKWYRELSLDCKAFSEKNNYKFPIFDDNYFDTEAELLPLNDKEQDYFRIRIGIQEYAIGGGTPPQTKEMVKTKIYNAQERRDASYQPLINCGDIQRYLLLWKGEYIKYGENLHCSRDINIFVNKHILVSRIFDKKHLKLKATLIPAGTMDQFYVNNTDSFNLFCCKPHDYIDLEAILGILNSKYMGFYLSTININLKRIVFPKINTKDLKSIKIPIKNPKLFAQISIIVAQILALKQADPKADTSELEREIDQLVYALYGLTDEEIKIVEGE